MFKVAKLTDYGVVILRHLAQSDEQAVCSARTLSEKSGLPLPTVSKLLKILAKNNIIKAKRGIAGGYQLLCPPKKLSLLRILEIFESSSSFIDCLGHSTKSCQIDQQCQQKDAWHMVYLRLADQLERISLLDLISQNAPLISLKGIRHV